MALRRELWRRGCRYRVHSKLPGTPDIAFMGARLAVFVDGCFWHGCPVHYTAPVRNAGFWGTKVARNRERDRQADARLEDLGWRVLRIWEHELSDVPAVASHIQARLSPGR
jgi:DNA mismatch endonuclease (patch repair protein)